MVGDDLRDFGKSSKGWIGTWQEAGWRTRAYFSGFKSSVPFFCLPRLKEFCQPSCTWVAGTERGDDSRPLGARCRRSFLLSTALRCHVQSRRCSCRYHRPFKSEFPGSWCWFWRRCGLSLASPRQLHGKTFIIGIRPATKTGQRDPDVASGDSRLWG